jgi:hypothetical protein
MRVFLSWSGERSYIGASALRDWIPDVLQEVNTWISKDIGAGQRWTKEIDEQLSITDFGILCLTQENLQEPWILFEAGALAKRVADDARIVPYLIDDIRPEDLKPPLGLFQAQVADRSGTYELVQSINSLLKTSLPTDRLDRLFDSTWYRLEESIQDIPASETEFKPRSTEEILSEILETVRGISKQVSNGYSVRPLEEIPQELLDKTWNEIVSIITYQAPAVAAVYGEARCDRFTRDKLVLKFPEPIYVKLAHEPRRQKVLLDIIEEMYGGRPYLINELEN